ncbi:MAG: hypothetical protein K2Y37_19545 [Pirellulales bacterium]|nr:hypothetical protein [Pirellulales bacterium]
MEEKPSRRGLQFRLSTWLVLVAILACAMTPLPHFFVTSLCLFAVFAVGVVREGVFSAKGRNKDLLALLAGFLVLIQLAAFSALLAFTHLVRIARLEILLAFTGLEVALLGCSTILLLARNLFPYNDNRTFARTANLAVLATTARILFEFLTMEPIEL